MHCILILEHTDPIVECGLGAEYRPTGPEELGVVLPDVTLKKQKQNEWYNIKCLCIYTR